MNFKKSLVFALSATMAFGTINIVDVQAAKPKKVSMVKAKAQQSTLKEIDAATLKAHAKAKSEMNPAQGLDGPASYAFDDENHWWHSNWRAEAGETGKPTAQNPIWIQTGFGGVKRIKKMTYTPRGDQPYGRIKDYKVMYANVPTGEVQDNDFKELTSGTLQDQAEEQEIVFENAVEATHIRLVATSEVYGNGGSNHVAAKRIRVFEEVQEAYTSKHTEYWEKEKAAGTLGTQDDNDTWYYQVQKKSDSHWENLPSTAFNGTTWMTNTTASAYNWAKLGKDEITGTLGGTEGNKYKALAFTWKAPQDGYFKMKLESPIGEAADQLAGFVKYSANESDGKQLWSSAYTKGKEIDSKIAKMSQGEFLRIGANSKNAWATGFKPMVVEVKASDYAAQYKSEVEQILTQHADKPEVLKAEVNKVKDALTVLLAEENKDEKAIDVKIKELEAAVAKVVSYVAVDSVTLNESSLKLKVGENATLNVTVNPEGATVKDVVWESNKTDVATVENGQVTAKGVGEATITVKSTVDETKSATCTVTVEAAVDKEALKTKLNEVKAIQKDDCSDASWTALQNAIEAAQVVVDQADATQDAVNEQVTALQTAVEGLRHLNRHADFWDEQKAASTLAKQEENDVWHYQIKLNDAWTDLPEAAFNGTTWMTNDAQSADYHWAKLAKDEITATFNKNEQKGLAFAWKASKAGYYKMTLEHPITAAGGDLNGFVTYATDTGDGERLFTGNFVKDATVDSRIAKMNVGDFLRIGASTKNAWATGFAPKVVEVTVKEYAQQYLQDVANKEEGNYTEASKQAFVAARTALQEAVNNNADDIETKLTALQDAVKALVPIVVVEKVELNKTETTLTVGAEETLTATVTPENATDKAVTWETSDADVVSVENGKLVAKKAGTATITAKTANGKSATCTVTVKAAVVDVEKVELNKTETTLTVGAEETLTATVTPENATDKAVTWETSDADVVSVENGKLVAKKAGTATITAKTANGKSAICMVTVKENVNKVDLEAKIKEAKALKEDDYSAASWKVLVDAINEATAVYNDVNATQAQVTDAVKALQEAINGLDKVYVIKVNGKVVAKGVAGDNVTIEAPKAPEGQVFAGWELDGKIVSEEATYSFKITGDASYKATYKAEVQPEKPSVDKSALEKAVADAKKIDLSKYKKNKAQEEFKEALAQALSVYNYDNATKEDVEKAIVRLDKAVKGLELLDAVKPNPDTNTDSNTNTNTDNQQQAPNTGDSTTLMAYVGLLFASFVGLLSTRKKTKKAN